MSRPSGRLAVVLFNLGGPDRPEAVRPFLFNLFNDRHIIELPAPFRWLLAQWISIKRAPVARAIYAHLGGASPLLAETEAQAAALEALLNGGPTRTGQVKCFIAMRYWHPRARQTAAAVKAFAPDRVVGLGLYPQYSGTTTGSSLAEWRHECARIGLHAAFSAVCCYPDQAGWIGALAARVRMAVDQRGAEAPRVLFSAHGLPKRIIAAGDPYQAHVERTAAAVIRALDEPGLDWRVCYQSRVGRLEWLGPSTDDEIRRAGAEGRGLVVVPIAFVSEHSETLVELDIEYRDLAREAGVPFYDRVGTVGTDASFISALAGLVEQAAGAAPGAVIRGEGGPCAASAGRCPNGQRLDIGEAAG